MTSAMLKRLLAMLRRRRVLVVGEDQDMVDSLLALLAIQGHNAKGIYSARTIVAEVRDFDPDVIIMDTAMPGTSGCDAAREVRQHRHGKRPVLIALAGHHPKDLAEISGYDYSFGRPLDTKVLFKLVASRPTK